MGRSWDKDQGRGGKDAKIGELCLLLEELHTVVGRKDPYKSP